MSGSLTVIRSHCQPKEVVVVRVSCRHCGKAYEFPVLMMDYWKWQGGKELIQEAMPYLSRGYAQLLMTQTCDPCWDELFQDEADDYGVYVQTDTEQEDFE